MATCVALTVLAATGSYFARWLRAGCKLGMNVYVVVLSLPAPPRSSLCAREGGREGRAFLGIRCSSPHCLSWSYGFRKGMVESSGWAGEKRLRLWLPGPVSQVGAIASLSIKHLQRLNSIGPSCPLLANSGSPRALGISQRCSPGCTKTARSTNKVSRQHLNPHHGPIAAHSLFKLTLKCHF